MIDLSRYNETLKRLGEDNTEVFYLSPEEIIDLHDAMIDSFGGSFGLRDDDLFGSVAVAPYQTMFGSELYPTLFDKAAKYIFDFANYQIFVDGNKRTALAVCDTFLQKNGFALSLTPEQAYALVMDIANHRFEDASQVSEVIKRHCSFVTKEAAEQAMKDQNMDFDTFRLR